MSGDPLDRSPPLDPDIVTGLLRLGYAFEIFMGPDYVDIVRPSGSVAFRIRREGSPPAEYDALIAQLMALRPPGGARA